MVSMLLTCSDSSERLRSYVVPSMVLYFSAAAKELMQSPPTAKTAATAKLKTLILFFSTFIHSFQSLNF